MTLPEAIQKPPDGAIGERVQRRLRIAFVYDALYPYLRGGGEKRFHELGKRLADRHEIHYVTWRFWADGESECTDADRIRLHGVGRAPAMYGADGKRTIKEALAFTARLPPVLLRNRFDVIDCSATPYLPLYSCWLAARIKRTPLVATWHELWGDHWADYLPDRPVVARVARWTEAASTRLGDLRVAVSPFTAGRLREAGVGADSIRIVPNGVCLDDIERAPESGEWSDVVFLGRLIEDKRVDVLVKALGQLRGEFPALRCIVIGDGPERAALEALTTALELDDNVRFLGQLADSAAFGILKASKVLALPSIREGFGIAAIEAQAAGLVPIVARSRHSGASFLVRDGIDGIVCNPDPESFASTLRSVFSDPDRLRRMRKQASAAAKQWDWDRLALEMEQTYLEVTHQVGRAS